MLDLLNRMSVKPVAVVLLCLGGPGLALAQDDEEALTNEAQNIANGIENGVALPESVEDAHAVWQPDAPTTPEEVRDLAFDRYVDLLLLGQAWEEKDPVLLTDVAIQLAEGERILLRSHKAFSADKLLGLAIRAATEKKDKPALERLASIVKGRNNDMLKSQVVAASKLAGESRAVDPLAMIPVDDTTPEAYATYHTLLKRAQAARIAGSRALLDDLEQATRNSIELSDEQRDYLLKIIAKSRAELPAGAQCDPAPSMLDKLAASSRVIPPPSELLNVRTCGEWLPGSYNFNGHKVRAFAGTFRGELTYENCRQAASELARYACNRQRTAKMVNTGLTMVRLNGRFGRTNAILGYVDETGRSFRWVGIRVQAYHALSEGDESFFYRCGDSREWRSDSWVKYGWSINGRTFHIRFADNDSGGIGWSFSHKRL